MATVKRKHEICTQYKIYLDIIYHFGNKVILMKQLFEYAKAFGLVKHYPQFHGQIQDLVHNEILKQEPFSAFGKKTQLHMLTMRKYALRFAEGKERSTDVGSVPKANTNERIMMSIFKNTYILTKILPRLEKMERAITIENIVDLLKSDQSSLLFNKNKGLDYLYTWDSAFIDKYLEKDVFAYDIQYLEELREKKNSALLRGAYASKGKGTGNLSSGEKNATKKALKSNKSYQENIGLSINPKTKKINSYNLDSMMNSYSYIAQIKEINSVLVVTILLFDVFNKQDLYKLLTHVASIYHMFNRYLKVDFKLKFGIIGFDEEGQKNFEQESVRPIKHAISKEIKGIMLSNTLENWSVDILSQEKIDVHYSHYDITNRYLDGIKHANLIRN